MSYFVQKKTDLFTGYIVFRPRKNRSILWVRGRLFRFLHPLSMHFLPDLHKLLQPIEERSAALRAHPYKNCLNVSFKTLPDFSASSTASIGQFHEDLATILPIAAPFYQFTFFEAIDCPHHRRGLNAQFCGNRADRVWFALLHAFH